MVYLTLQLTGGAACRVATTSGGLLPRLFTLTNRSWRSFSVTLNPEVTPGFPLGNVMLCVARTFLSAAVSSHAERQATQLAGAKVVLLIENGESRIENYVGY